MENNITDFFDPEVQKIIRDDGCVYTMKNESGIGVVTQYLIMPGIEFFYNDFHMKGSPGQNKIPYNRDIIEINHCREGRFECVFDNGYYQYIGAGDVSVHKLTENIKEMSFPMSHFHGISITIDLEIATQTLRKIESIIGTLDIDLYKIADIFCKEEMCFVFRNHNIVGHIFSELYGIKPKMIAHNLKVKVLELLMYLNDINIEEYKQIKRYFSKNQVEIIKKIRAYMIKNIQIHYTLKELSEMFDISLTSMKNCFKGVYGSSIYAYMKTYRMQAAAILLKEEDASITEIAIKMGYENPSKFSECFKKEFGVLPSQYKKSL